jgi:hypothetical protein
VEELEKEKNSTKCTIMKFGGVSWNTSHHHKQGVQNKFVCSECGRQYKMEHARINHQKLCKEYHGARE